MKKSKIVDSIDLELSILLKNMSEEEYVTFIRENQELLLFDIIVDTPFIELLSYDFLDSILQLIKNKNKMLD